MHAAAQGQGQSEMQRIRQEQQIVRGDGFEKGHEIGMQKSSGEKGYSNALAIYLEYLRDGEI